ncbi:sterol desaturase family protein [Aurantivibrio plasticivorans]
MLYTIAIIQTTVFIFFFMLERLIPKHNHPIARGFTFWWAALGIFCLLWLRLVFFYWVDLPNGFLSLEAFNPVVQGFMFYVFYSFGNYWIHRWKHQNSILWRFVHHLHHSPSHMESRLAFYRHPLEVFFNTVYLIFLGKVIFNISPDVLAIALAIEGCLECFHHSNIQVPRWMRPLGYVIQLPGMHLVHHEYRLHKFNYAPFLWDCVFNTVKIPEMWDKQLGFSNSHDIKSELIFRKPS